jgi:hypothetical protein
MIATVARETPMAAARPPWVIRSAWRMTRHSPA